MRIGIVGAGFVGLSFAAVLGSKGQKVIIHDIDKEKLEKIKNGIPPFYEPKLQATLRKAIRSSIEVTSNVKKIVDECDFIFITVGTPIKSNGVIDLSSVKSVVSRIGTVLKSSKNKPLIIIKSTVVPGTNNTIKKILEEKSGKKCGRGFELLSNPEFLKEGSAIKDTIKPHVVIIGGEHKKIINKLERFYHKFHSSKIPFIQTNPQTAELIKYANNSFLATKISFINQIANICQTTPGTNVDDVANAIGIDPRIGNLFLRAGPGYGGSCLPKDLKSFISFSSKNGQKNEFLRAVQKTNTNQVTKILSLIRKVLPSFKNKQITVLGLSFKENSDDIRESVSIKLIKLLLRCKAKVIVHDPVAIQNTKKVFGDKILYTKKISDALHNSECAVIMTPWTHYRKLTNKDFRKMKKKAIVDTRRLLADKKLDASYYALGMGN